MIHSTRYQNLLLGLGIFELVAGIISAFIFISALLKVNSGAYGMLIPIWQYIAISIILISLQVCMGICAILFRKNDKVQICQFVGIALLLCIALNLFIIQKPEGSLTSNIAPFIFPALYTAIAMNLKIYNKDQTI